MHGLVAVIVGFVVTVLALVGVWRVMTRFSRPGSLDNVFVSRDWLVHHRDDPS